MKEEPIKIVKSFLRGIFLTVTKISWGKFNAIIKLF